MLLVAGGQLDPNIGGLLRRILERKVSFRDLLVGSELIPRVTIDIRSRSLVLAGEGIRPSACFIRHDVFLHQKSGLNTDHTSALNWFYAIRGWALGNPSVRIFNRHSYLSENNKIENLCFAVKCGLSIPDTIVTNEFALDRKADWIQKPVAGGSLTTTLKDFLEDDSESKIYARFLQCRMKRPELRIYRIGSVLIGFDVSSPELDYRKTNEATIQLTEVPANIATRLLEFADLLGLDFAAADFMRDENGDLHFLEINSQPMFAAFDRVANGKLADAIIDHLLRPQITGSTD